MLPDVMEEKDLKTEKANYIKAKGAKDMRELATTR
jgi:hypothetical protein